MFVRCFCELNVCLDEYELFARPRVAGHYNRAISRVIDRSLIVTVVRESSLVNKVIMYIFKFASLSYHSFRSFYVAEGEKSLGTCFRSSKRKALSTQWICSRGNIITRNI